MKKIQALFASAAVLLAIGGVYASTLVVDVYYRPFLVNKDATTGVFCEETTATLCADLSGPRCVQEETYPDPEGGDDIVDDVIISKKINGQGDCLPVLRDN